MPAAGFKKKTKLLKDQLKKNEDYRDELEREIMAGTEVAVELEGDSAEAHTLFLFGRNGKRPVRDLVKLADMTGIPKARLEILAPVWRREAMRMAREASPLFAMAASTKARKNHQDDLDKMRQKIDEFEASLPSPKADNFSAKYRMLMMMRKEWQDSAGITSAINISQTMLLLEGKMQIEAANKVTDKDEEEDLSAFDIDV